MAGKRITDLAAATALTGVELVEISQLSDTVTITAATISAAATDNSFNDSGDGFETAGFEVGDRVNVTGFTGDVANNILVGVVTDLTAGKMTIGGTDGDVIVDEAAGATVTISKWLSVRSTAQDIADLGGGGSAEYPSFAGNAGKVLAVNVDEDDVEWVEQAAGSGIGSTSAGFIGRDNVIDYRPADPDPWNDEFDGDTLDPGWTWVNQVDTGVTGTAEVKNSSLRLSLSAPQSGQHSRLLYKDLPAGDFDIIAKVRLSKAFSPQYHCVAIGLIDTEGGNKFHLNKFMGRDSTSGGTNYCGWVLWTNPTTASSENNFQTEATEMYLRLKKTSSVQVSFQASRDGIAWQQVQDVNMTSDGTYDQFCIMTGCENSTYIQSSIVEWVRNFDGGYSEPEVIIDESIPKVPPNPMHKIVGGKAKWVAARARGSSDPARFIVVGDSNVSGQGAGTGTGNLTGAYEVSFAHKLADKFGFNTDHIFGDQNVGVSVTYAGTYDTRLSVSGSGWGIDSTAQIAGGRFFVATSNSSGLLRFTPEDDVESFKVWTPKTSGITTNFVVSIDGSPVDTFSQAGTAALESHVYNETLGSHYIEFSNGGAGGGTGFFMGVETFDGTDNPHAFMLGWAGAKMADIAKITDPWSSLKGMIALEPDYTVLYCTINDIAAATSGATYYEKLYDILQNQPTVGGASGLSSIGDGCLVMGFPVDDAQQYDSYGDNIATMLRNAARDAGWSFIDLRYDLGFMNITAGARGYKYDGAHPNLAGHEKIAQLIYDFLHDEVGIN